MLKCSNENWLSHTVAITLFAIGLTATPGLSAITFTKIADTNSSVPNGQPGETFSNGLGIRPGVSNGTVVFLGGGPSTSGLYTGSGGPLSVVVDTNTKIPPANTANFSTIGIAGGASISGGNVSFNDGSNQGVYALLSGSLVNIVNSSTAIPGGTGNFSASFATNAISGNNVAFAGRGGTVVINSQIVNQVGIYTSFNHAAINDVADLHTAIPGGTGNFTGFGLTPAISGTNVVFTAFGSGTQKGVFANATGTGGTITALATDTTAIPHGSGDFNGFAEIAASGSNVAFVGLDSSFNPGVYSDIGGTVAAVADGTTPVPGGGADNFIPTSFSSVSISGSTVAFIGSGTHEQGIYLDTGGVLSKLISTGDILDGQTVNGLSISPNSIDGNNVAFTVQFGNSSAVYLATLPEPASAALIGLAALPLLRRRSKTLV